MHNNIIIHINAPTMLHPLHVMSKFQSSKLLGGLENTLYRRNVRRVSEIALNANFDIREVRKSYRREDIVSDAFLKENRGVRSIVRQAS